jgi:hypothetical protein
MTAAPTNPIHLIAFSLAISSLPNTSLPPTRSVDASSEVTTARRMIRSSIRPSDGLPSAVVGGEVAASLDERRSSMRGVLEGRKRLRAIAKMRITTEQTTRSSGQRACKYLMPHGRAERSSSESGSNARRNEVISTEMPTVATHSVRKQGVKSTPSQTISPLSQL